MSFTFVIPDIHGRADLLELALDQIELHDGGTVVFWATTLTVDQKVLV
jgi:hypothetical protein